MKTLSILVGILLLPFSVSAFAVTDLETEHLYLRKAELSDSSALAEMALNPHVTKLTGMFPAMQTVEEVANFTSKFLMGENGEAPRYPYAWVVVEKQCGKVIGLVCLVAYVERHARGEIGYAFNQAFWNKGYATESTKAVIDYMASQGVVRIYATVDPDNSASERVLQKVGMAYEGLMRAYMIVHSKHVDRKLYAFIAAH